VDVRIIAATHQDLEEAIEKNRFREDLYYRLNVITIRVPTLRERREDIAQLAHHFLNSFVRVTGKQVEGFDEDAMRLLHDYDYPGNVRELQNIIESATVFCQDGLITPSDLPRVIRNVVGRPVREVRIAAGTPLEEVERLCIIETLKHTEGNKRRAAALLGISEKSVYNKLDRYNISVDSLNTEDGDPQLGSSAPDQFERV
jgi:DNA-binding NtrC family response regulator